MENILLGIEAVENKLTPLILEHTRQLGQVGLVLTLYYNHNIHSNSSIIKYYKMYLIYFLIKVLEKNSDLKTREAFEEVIALLKTCKDGAVERIFR